MKQPDFKTPQEVIVAWREYIKELRPDLKNSERVAGRMVGVTLASEIADELYEKDVYFASIDDELWNLEWSNVDMGSLSEIWEGIERRLRILERRYVPGADFKKPQEVIHIWRQVMKQPRTKISSELAFEMVDLVHGGKLLGEYFEKDKDFAYAYRNISILQDPDLDEDAQKAWNRIEQRLTILEKRYKD